ncbi:MAG TPA: GNAT family N-acetyltransferase [Polyangia bacterium]|nr:GNAT family N-acetyltransferase [Polyangia bacterium]
MNKARLWAVEWRQGGELLAAIEPTAEELRRAAPALAAFYNDDHNRRMMAHADEPHTPEDVVAYYEELRVEEGRPFLLYLDGVLMGDADFRNLEGDIAEFAIMIGGRAAQGRGLGTRFGRMLHAFGFGTLGLARIYISVIPANTASRRLFEKLGYQIDDSPQAREFVDEPSDITMSLPRDAFDRARTDELAAIRAFERPAS